jgi:sulfoxide reductase heme-binding subunit YedZ
MLSDWRSGAFGPLPVIGLVYWSGVWATVLLLLTLSVTPIRHMLKWNGLIEVRRTIGLAGLTYSLIHLVSFFALYRWDWSGIVRQAYSRPSLIVATASLLGFLALGLTSTDAAVRWLGPKNWHRLHRANYILTALAVAHFLLSPGIFSVQYLIAGLLFFLLTWRLLKTRGTAPTPMELAILSVGAALFAVALEIGWLWAYQHVPVLETLADLMNFDEELPPPLLVLVAGLLFSATAALVRSGLSFAVLPSGRVRPNLAALGRRRLSCDEPN